MSDPTDFKGFVVAASDTVALPEDVLSPVVVDIGSVVAPSDELACDVPVPAVPAVPAVSDVAELDDEAPVK